MKTTEEFMRDLPRTPIYRQVEHVHSILLFLYGQSAHGYGENAVEMAEHSLRQIAIASVSMLTPEERYAEQMRRERVDHPLTRPLPNFHEAMREAFGNMSGTIRRMRLLAPSPEAKEDRAAREYRRMLRSQRTQARVHLQREVARVRRELGLNETGAGQ